MEEKQCSKCRKVKPISEFDKNPKNKDRLSYWCKDCVSEYNRIYRKNNRSCLNKKYMERYYADPKKKREINRSYKRNHREESREVSRKHYQNNKEYYKEKQHRYMNTENGKLAAARSKSKRKRELGFILLFNNPFPQGVKINYHHINNLLVIPVPESIHIKTLGKKHREKMNKEIKKLYGLDLQELLVS